MFRIPFCLFSYYLRFNAYHQDYQYNYDMSESDTENVIIHQTRYTNNSKCRSEINSRNN